MFPSLYLSKIWFSKKKSVTNNNKQHPQEPVKCMLDYKAVQFRMLVWYLTWILLKSTEEFMNSKILKICNLYLIWNSDWSLRGRSPGVLMNLPFVLTGSHLDTMRGKTVGRITGLRKGIGESESQKHHERCPPNWELSNTEPGNRVRCQIFLLNPPSLHMCHGVLWKSEDNIRLAPAFHLASDRVSYYDNLVGLQAPGGLSYFCLPSQCVTSGITGIHIITLTFTLMSSVDTHLGPHTHMKSTLSIDPSHQPQNSISKNVNIWTIKCVR